ncbi:hypothetical protein [Flavobacterium hibernum]|uniref:Uncharacterized protein n=1 Tax=Flavobacterium hibernum TaxID=37752 RepID=A0A0D0EVL3_9FLAO|nr:hypothetical protein [Flavobacterium hibernum]KIO50956.1 hypothetical protein IW18_20440 [Flavobacterium hibernum]OXA85199.1 hypothetical protein B0A73_17780 [Flavobacterium hibernum]
MYDILKNIASDNDWVFEYAPSDYQNLYNKATTEKVHLFIDPITIESRFSDSGNETQTFSGYFMLLFSSDVDEEYTTKYETYIKPLITTSTQAIKDSLLCSDLQINKFQSTEVINRFDFNLDGILVNYNITLID